MLKAASKRVGIADARVGQSLRPTGPVFAFSACDAGAVTIARETPATLDWLIDSKAGETNEGLLT